MARKKLWIQDLKRGTLTRQAKKAGMTVKAFCKKVLANKEKYSTKTVKRCYTARTLGELRKKKKK